MNEYSPLVKSSIMIKAEEGYKIVEDKNNCHIRPFEAGGFNHTDVNHPFYKNHQIENRLDKLEELNEFILGHRLGEKNLANRVQDLETNNDEIDIRIDEIEEYLREVKELYSNPLQQEVWQENIIKRLEKLEQMQSAMLTMPNLVWRKYHKTPHKCPNCEGKTYCTNPNFQDGDDITFCCKSCEGKGIVWG